VRTSDVPIRVAFSPDSKYAFVPNRLGNCVSVIDTSRKLEIKRIPVGFWPGGTDFNANGSKAYVANNKTNDVSVIDVATLKVINTIDAGIHPDGLIFCRVEGKI
jgi:YVTN family beta-propeller protein